MTRSKSLSLESATPNERDLIVKRFFNFVDKRGPIMPGMRTRCWIWTGAKIPAGYGVFSCERVVGRRQLKAHRVSWALFRGPIPAGIDALHRCDNPKCARPSHLFLGDAADNARDREHKGRGKHVMPCSEDKARGEQHGRHKLTEKQVARIKWLQCNSDFLATEIAKAAGVSAGTISNIFAKKNWAHVPVPKERPT